MRVERQGMPVEVFPMKREGATPDKKAHESNGANEKIGLQELKKNKEGFSSKGLQDEINTANNALEIVNYHLQFRLHEASGRYHVKVIDTNTEEVIREIPPESVLEFSANIRKMLDEAIGYLVDEIV